VIGQAGGNGTRQVGEGVGLALGVGDGGRVGAGVTMIVVLSTLVEPGTG